MNNLKELFEIQAGLDAEILNNHPVQEGEDRLEKKHAALLVELGEMFNEWRAFKFWSTDQRPRKDVTCIACEGDGTFYYPSNGSETCPGCKGTGKVDKLLGELVDCLHFVLSIGLEHGFDEDMSGLEIEPIKYTHENAVISQFLDVIKADWQSYECGDGGYYHEGLEMFLVLCQMLGYTWKKITAAYLEKNQENHYRQQSGY
jgi:dimeric dUTPase (all-alpha-NTP-PPase superfamily)